MAELQHFLTLLDAFPLILAILAGIFGLMVGSFLNVVIYRLPRIMARQWRAEVQASFPGVRLPPVEGQDSTTPYNLVIPRSACPGCNTQIRASDNVPILSWLWLRGRCRACGIAISGRYPLVELLTGLAFAYCGWRFNADLQLLGALIFTGCLVALIGIDIDEMLLPDQITLPLLWLGLLFNWQGAFVPLPEALLGAVAGYLSLWLVFWAFKLLTGKEGMGYGDFKLLAALGAWLGWQQLPLVILLSSLVGALFGIAMMLRRGESRPIPFGPYLAIAGWIALFWGEAICRWYLGLLTH